jgi:NADP-dependent 3-hydroxy acid dehydrogenase YdfG
MIDANTFRLDGRIALVTGSSAGIGLAPPVSSTATSCMSMAASRRRSSRHLLSSSPITPKELR